MKTLSLFIVLMPLLAISQTKQNTSMTSTDGNVEIATFGNGCFWCTEAIFQRVEGVEKVVSGYTGGAVKNPTYKEVCTGLTGHAEAIQITFDPRKISFTELLEIFWQTHDPTTLNRQGADVGTQYRSAIFYHNETQKKLAEEYKQKLNAAGAFDKPIVTEITQAVVFYTAENYHQNYYNLNGKAPYCSYVIEPKLEKFEKVFSKKLKR
ncbi:peptide-methionine (S)-S-oxide reductase [Chryseotalea sanaruensis]|uniref:Peptide methionine sulfoxide reductase MsrA n=2 Tax=Chryseotalea sanaruensis TaxID=2482724 RepID=A0A401UE38_9BACT|nr:peptide-methionine (S)-S-oxide reductase MsrA [Chryseotalea sanaruensis]GCC53137.1 peptide-methionine (S)-S-oxide reductase [Chryseotalea sanaruensis]